MEWESRSEERRIKEKRLDTDIKLSGEAAFETSELVKSLANSVIPNEKFHFELRWGTSGILTVYLVGIMDDDALYDEIKEQTGPLCFNFKEVISINSIAIRNWVNFVNELKSMRIFYEECPPLIVRQMNMVPSFKGHAEVRSVQLNYACDKCDHEELFTFDGNGKGMATGQISESQLPPEKTCENCKKGQLEFDESVEEYFAFLEP